MINYHECCTSKLNTPNSVCQKTSLIIIFGWVFAISQILFLDNTVCKLFCHKENLACHRKISLAEPTPDTAEADVIQEEEHRTILQNRHHLPAPLVQGEPEIPLQVDQSEANPEAP